MDRRSTLLGLTSGVVSGPELLQNLQAWLTSFDPHIVEDQSSVFKKNLSSEKSKVGSDHIDFLQLATRKLYSSCKYYGGSEMTRELALNLLYKVSSAAKEKQAPMIQQELYKIMASLAHTIAKTSWHAGLECCAQNYYQLALRAAHAGHDRLFSVMILVDHAWQMYFLNKFQDGLNLLQLAQQGAGGIAGPQVKAMLAMYEAWGYAAMGQKIKFQRFMGLAEKFFAGVKNGEEPYWVSFCDESELTGMVGRGFSLLATHKPKQYAEQASELYAKTIELRACSTYRYAALDYIWLAKSRFLLKDTEVAAAATKKALTIYHELHNRCGATHRRLQELYQYTKQSTRSKQIQALNLKLKTVLAIT